MVVIQKVVKVVSSNNQSIVDKTTQINKGTAKGTTLTTLKLSILTTFENILTILRFVCRIKFSCKNH